MGEGEGEAPARVWALLRFTFGFSFVCDVCMKEHNTTARWLHLAGWGRGQRVHARSVVVSRRAAALHAIFFSADRYAISNMELLPRRI